MSRFLSGTLRGYQKQIPIPEYNPSCKAQLSTIESSQHLLQHKQLVCKVQHRSMPIPLLQPSCDEKQSTMDSSSCSFRRVLPSRLCGTSNVMHSCRKSEVLLASNSVRNHAAPPSPCPSRKRCTSDSCCPASCMGICRDISSRHLLDHKKTESQLSSTIHCTHPLTQIGCLNKDCWVSEQRLKVLYLDVFHKTVLNVRMSRFLSGILLGYQKQTPIPELKVLYQDVFCLVKYIYTTQNHCNQG